MKTIKIQSFSDRIVISNLPLTPQELSPLITTPIYEFWECEGGIYKWNWVETLVLKCSGDRNPQQSAEEICSFWKKYGIDFEFESIPEN